MPVQPQPPIPPSTPHILRIPGEIRNKIYENLILFSHPLCIYRQSQQPDHDNNPTPPSLAATLLPIFLTCRQTHLEASAFFYSQNKFTLPRDAPHQSQVNVLFRHFLDRLGPAKAALLRHLALPFPIDPEQLFHFYYTAEPAERDPLGEDGSLVLPLRERCPALETVEFDLRGGGHWLRLRGPGPATMREAFLGGPEEALWEAFPRLEYVDLRLREGTARQWRGVADCEVLTAGTCWQEGEGEEDGPAPSPPWKYPVSPRYSRYLLYAPPAKALRSDIHNSWTTGDLVADYVRVAGAWLRSPRRAMREWEDSSNWREWNRTMIAQAGPVGSPLYCSGTSNLSAVPARPKKRVLGFLPSRG
jgi:hypothetical protein